eukprot:2255230-Alexandrium_andersonii.AAC.1
MSASLVGSEMCIRDRLHPLRAPGRGSPAAVLSSEPERVREDRGRSASACLLYTSDAADDM